jgi:hypothetical protein
MITPKAEKWSAEEALRLIRWLHPVAYAAGWNLHLGGSLATDQDTSSHDADILAMPRYQVKAPNEDPVMSYLSDEWYLIGLATLPYRRSFRMQHRLSHKMLDLIFVHHNPSTVA